jgi:formimidoylglutamate deiminase
MAGVAASAAQAASLTLAALTWTGDRFARDVAVAVCGARVVFVGPRVEAEAALRAGGAAVWQVRERPARALLPGLVNCHSHAFQRDLRGLGESFERGSVDSFWTWRDSMYRLVDALGDEASFYESTFKCLREMRRSGITAVGEFHYLHHARGPQGRWALDAQVVSAARRAGMRLVLLSAFYAFGGFGGKELNATQQRFATPSLDEYWEQLDALRAQLAAEDAHLAPAERGLVTVGVVAHSLRAVSQAQLAGLLAGAQQRGLPFHLHIEEQPKEVEDCRAHYAGRAPMRVLLDTADAGGLTRLDLVTAVHCNHTEPAELRELARRGGNVCICPLTEGNLGDGVMPDFAACALRVCLGTDCNARIDMLEEARWLDYSQRLRRLERGVCTKAACEARLGAGAGASTSTSSAHSGPELFWMATDNGARSLAINAGRVSAGCLADLIEVAIDAPELDLHSGTALQDKLMAALIFGCCAKSVVRETCVNGQWRDASE